MEPLARSPARPGERADSSANLKADVDRVTRAADADEPGDDAFDAGRAIVGEPQVGRRDAQEGGGGDGRLAIPREALRDRRAHRTRLALRIRVPVGRADLQHDLRGRVFVEDVVAVGAPAPRGGNRHREAAPRRCAAVVTGRPAAPEAPGTPGAPGAWRAAAPTARPAGSVRGGRAGCPARPVRAGGRPRSRSSGPPDRGAAVRTGSA